MRTRVKNNVLDAISFPIDGAKLENNMAVLGGVVIPDANGVQSPAIIVDGDQVYLFSIGRVFTIVGGPNAGTYTVIPGTLGNGAEYNTFPTAPHIANTTEIPVAPDPLSTSAGGTIDGFGIDMGASVNTSIVDMADPTNLQDAATKIYVDNQIVNLVVPLLKAVMPPGSVAAWGGTGLAPSGWLLCDGTSYLSATYPDLFANIGTTYGVGSNDFMVPDLRGRFPLGKSNGSGSNKVIRPLAQNLADIDGVEEVILDATEIPLHNHPGSTTGTEPAHSHSGSVGNGGSHDHQMRTRRFNIDFDPGPVVIGDWIHPTRYSPLSGRIANSGSHNHPITGVNTTGSHSHSITINTTTGGGNPHDNVQPYLTIQYIIKV